MWKRITGFEKIDKVQALWCKLLGTVVAQKGLPLAKIRYMNIADTVGILYGGTGKSDTDIFTDKPAVTAGVVGGDSDVGCKACVFANPDKQLVEIALRTKADEILVAKLAQCNGFSTEGIIHGGQKPYRQAAQLKAFEPTVIITLFVDDQVIAFQVGFVQIQVDVKFYVVVCFPIADHGIGQKRAEGSYQNAEMGFRSAFPGEVATALSSSSKTTHREVCSL